MACVSTRVNRTARLRELLRGPAILQGPGAFDGLSARLVECAGFPFCFMSGFSVAGARLGAPDTGLISYAEMVAAGREMVEATRHIPIIADGDTGYGNCVNVRRTVQGYAAAGLSGIQLEDQGWPKSCGHVAGKTVVPRAEAVARVRAACDARDEGEHDILIVARTDARSAVGLEEALWRAAAFAEAGADVIIADALRSEEEMAAFCAVAPHVPKMANIFEGGLSPVLPPARLQALGYSLCIYSVSLIGVASAAMHGALREIAAGRNPAPPAMPTFDWLQQAVGFPEYRAQEARYALPSAAAATPVTPADSGASAVAAADGIEVQAASGAAACAPAALRSLAHAGSTPCRLVVC